MSLLTHTTDKAAIVLLQEVLPYFGRLDSLGLSGEDAFAARQAENLLRGIVESSPYYNET